MIPVPEPYPRRSFVAVSVRYKDKEAEMILTLGLWVHVTLNAIACFAPTRNPIWGELRLVGVIVATVALWTVLAASI